VEGVRFAAAHFATFGGACEPLHGHSYEVAAEVEGALGKDAWVLDFVKLKSILREISRELDHRFLLQRDSDVIRVDASPTGWHVATPAGLSYELPEADVVALPIDNTTAERLAQWFSGRLWQALRKHNAANLISTTVEVWEGPGQRASYFEQRLPVE
jgi:6-pyruvoyltetrahydropterin/6-carboxytetrahydropterin synthase